MALTKIMSDALNKQFNEELNSAYLYESMAADFHSKKLSGFATWMTQQAGEERFHAEKLHRYLDESGERVFYAAIPEPKAIWNTALDAIQDALKHEKYITGCIHNLVRTARKQDDIATESFLDWYITEQVEEESSVQTLIDKLEFVGDNKFGLYQLDKEVAASRQQEE